MTGKEQFCFWCGESLGVYLADRSDMDTCGALDCEREAKYQQQSERADRRAAAEHDDYEQYRERY